MKVEIWSDVVCPFCYIGKREFEKALNQFSESDKVIIEWKSYQLAPDMPNDTDKSIYEHLAEKYSMTLEESIASHKSVAERAKGLGLDYNFDIAVLANTSLAHQTIHFANDYGKQAEAEEALFRAYFTEGKNIADKNTLSKLIYSLDLDSNLFEKALNDERYKDAVLAEIQEGQQLGLRGVPFFVFDRKYAIAGAQDSSAFLELFEKISSEKKA